MSLEQITTSPRNITRPAVAWVPGSGSISKDELYWILHDPAYYQTTTEKFVEAVDGVVAEILGAGNYVLVLNVTSPCGGGDILVRRGRLANQVFWAGDAGVLPGFGKDHGVSCEVFWG